MRILVVEDARDMNRLIVKTLTREGYTVDGCFDGEEAELYLEGAEYDAVLLDVMLPRRDGYEVLRRLRARGILTPVLFLTARDTVEDRVRGLDLGADDYLVKPFDFAELLARIRAMTRKSAGSRSNIFTLADLTVDTARHTVSRGGRQILLIAKEYAILEHLIRQRGAIVSREQLEDRIWSFEGAGSSNNIDVYISRLRKKIDGDFPVKLLHTVRGIGWALREEEREP
ncbi:MAG: response regulator transcription factor [Clostridia bacterium]|nr:response regulator transcription factor [Clostridia bacterium]